LLSTSINAAQLKKCKNGIWAFSDMLHYHPIIKYKKDIPGKSNLNPSNTTITSTDQTPLSTKSPLKRYLLPSEGNPEMFSNMLTRSKNWPWMSPHILRRSLSNAKMRKSAN